MPMPLLKGSSKDAYAIWSLMCLSEFQTAKPLPEFSINLLEYALHALSRSSPEILNFVSEEIPGTLLHKALQHPWVRILSPNNCLVEMFPKPNVLDITATVIRTSSDALTSTSLDFMSDLFCNVQDAIWNGLDDKPDVKAMLRLQPTYFQWPDEISTCDDFPKWAKLVCAIPTLSLD
jgi:hypothetical protein